MASAVSQYHKPRLLSCRSMAVLLAVFLAVLLPVAAAHTLPSDGRHNILSADFRAVPATAQASTPAVEEVPAETLIVDDRIPVIQDGHWTFISNEDVHDLRKRAAKHGTTTTSTATTATITASSSIGSVVTTATETSATSTSTALPKFFDYSLAANFSTTDGGNCEAFIEGFLNNATFQKCYPFSLLLQGSKSFFNAEKSLVTITQVLDASCAANATFCAAYLSELATNLTDSANCGADYKLGNSIVVEAYMGMQAYQPLYTASCLKDPTTKAYCFGNAVTNLTTPSNVYFYYLPLNISLPGSSIPSCNWCLENTMAVYQSASANRNLPIAFTYGSAAQQVDTICGPGFANQTLPTALKSAATSPLRQGHPPVWLSSALLLVGAIHLLVL